MNIKICGLTRIEDVERSVAFGAWATGFIFYPKSLRYVDPARAAGMVTAARGRAITVGVFVNEEADRMLELHRQLGLDWLQLHGDETPELAESLGVPFIKAVRLRTIEDLDGLEAWGEVPGLKGILLDAAVDGQFGGTGVLSDWELALQAEEFGQVILSGGLNAVNIKQAIQKVRPFAVDVSSGVESGPGVKDPVRLEAFFKAVQETRSS